jgi:protein-S-isoprenylcysteine O-methyltransferase Ste14
MTKFDLKIFLKAAYEIILVFLQFFIICLHFVQWKFIPKKQIIQVSPFSYFVGFLIIIIALIILLVAIKDLGRNLSPFPRPIKNSNLVTTGIYRFTRHPMYYSLIFISFGFFVTKLSIYYLFLSTSLALIIKFKIDLEEEYLNNKFKNYLLYKDEVKY